MRRRTIAVLFTAALLAIQLCLLVTSARQENQTVDEGVHLAAGFSYWKTGDFRMNPEHPPLMKLLASVPLLSTRIHLPTDDASWSASDEWAFARQFLYHNTLKAETILFLGRLPTIFLAIALGSLIALWAWKLWGTAGTILSLTAYVFDTTILAHGRYVTTDIGVSFFFILTIFCFSRFLRKPTLRRFLLVAIVFALAQVTKFSAIILLPILVLLWLLKYLKTSGEARTAFRFRNAVTMALVLLAVTNMIIFVFYFGEIKTPLSQPQFTQTYRSGIVWKDLSNTQQHSLAQVFQRITDPKTSSGAIIEYAFQHLPVPAYDYFRGLSQVIWHNYWGHASYLMGHQSNHGWWYYFPIAFLVKTSLATLILLLLTLTYFVRLLFDRVYRSSVPGRRFPLFAAFQSSDDAYLLLIVPVIVYMALSMSSHLNLGVRHILPVLPLLCLLLGSLATIRFRRRQRLWQATLFSLLVFIPVHTIFVYPHFLASFSELVGGPENGARYLTDSNLDWGQDLRNLGLWESKNNIPYLYIVYFGQTPMEYYLHDFRYLPHSDEPEKIAALDGWAAASATALFGSDDYTWLRQRHPDKKIGYSIFLYDLRK